MSEDTPRPVLRIVRGEPSDAELAALLAVVAARSAAPAEPEAEVPSAWRDRAALLRQPLHPGPGAWRASARRF
jgi:hypothetical protein